MKELFYLNYQADIPSLKLMSIESLEPKVDLIYSLGYAYNPYDTIFHNFYINDTITSMDLKTLSYADIREKYNDRRNAFESANGSHIRTKEQVKEFIQKENTLSNSNLTLFIESSAGDIGLYSLLIAVISYLFISINLIIYFAVFMALLATLFTSFYVLRNLGLSFKEHQQASLSDWKQKKNFFFMICLISYLALLYFLYVLFSNIWLPFILVFIIYKLIGRYTHKRLSKGYWLFSSYNL